MHSFIAFAVGEAISRKNEPVQKIIAPQFQAHLSVPNFDVNAKIQGPAPLPLPLQAFTHQPAVSNVPIPVDFPMTPASPVISVPVQPFVPSVLPTVHPSWLQQKVSIGCNSYFPAQSVAPLATIALGLHTVQATCAQDLTEHQSGSEEYMDITDEDGDSWMRPSEFGEIDALQEPALQTTIQTVATPAEATLQCTHVNRPAQQTTVVAYNPTPAVGPTRGLPGSHSNRLHRKDRACRLSYRPYPSVSLAVPSPNRKPVRSRGIDEPGRRGPTSDPLSARN